MPPKKIKAQAEELAGEIKTRLEDNTSKGQERKMAALSYVFILCLVPLLGDKKSAFVQFHAKQGLVLFVIEVFAGLIAWFPIFGQLFVLSLFIVSVMGVVKTLRGEKWEIPFVYEWSKKVNV